MSSGHADLDRQRYDIVACREVAFDVAENFWGGFLYGVRGVARNLFWGGINFYCTILQFDIPAA